MIVKQSVVLIMNFEIDLNRERDLLYSVPIFFLFLLLFCFFLFLLLQIGG